MDLRFPVAIALALAYSIWLAWSALKDPANTEKRLSGYATFAFMIGALFLGLEVLAHFSSLPLDDILLGRMKSTRSQGVLAFSYACFAASGVFWIASTRAKG